MRTNLQADRPAALVARLQMDPVQGGPARCSGRPRRFPNPFAGLQRLVAGLSEQRQLTRDVQDRAAALGGNRGVAVGSTPEEFRRLIDKEAADWRAVVAKFNIKPGE